MENNIQTQKKFHYAWVILAAMCGIMIGTMGTGDGGIHLFYNSYADDGGLSASGGHNVQ